MHVLLCELVDDVDVVDMEGKLLFSDVTDAD